MNRPGHPGHGKICVVADAEYYHRDDPTVRRVAVYCAHDEEIKKYGEPFLKPKNIIKYSALLESQLIEIEPSFLRVPVFKHEMIPLALLVVDNLKDNISSFEDEKIVLKHRLLGAWINFVYGLEGMVYVSNAIYRSYSSTLKTHWNGIGEFFHREMWKYKRV